MSTTNNFEVGLQMSCQDVRYAFWAGSSTNLKFN